MHSGRDLGRLAAAGRTSPRTNPNPVSPRACLTPTAALYPLILTTIPSSATLTLGAVSLFARSRMAGPRCVRAILRARSSPSLGASSLQLKCPSSAGSASVHSQTKRSAPSASGAKFGLHAVSPVNASSRPPARTRRWRAPSSGRMCAAAKVLTRRPAARATVPGAHSR